MEIEPVESPKPVTSIARKRFLIPPAERIQFIILFAVLSGLGWSIGTSLMRYLTIPITGTFFDSGLVQGICIGIAQWIVLRRYIPSKSWILATTLGWAFSMGVGGKLVSIFINYERLGFFVAFICLGFAQWLVLRKHTKHSWVWIPISILPSVLVDALEVVSISKPNAIIEIVRIISIGGIPALSLCFFQRKVSSSDN
jgi:hypothetical protein